MYIQRLCSFARRIKVSALALLLFPFTSDCLRSVPIHPCNEYAMVSAVISHPLPIPRPPPPFAPYVSVASASSSCYTSRPNLDSNGAEKEICCAVR